jgi:hypothetical protein
MERNCEKIQELILQGQKVQEQWTICPNGNAKTVAVTGSGVRLSPDEDHCSIFVVGTVINLRPTRRRKAMVSQSKISETTSITASCCSSSSQDDEALMTKINEEEYQNKHDETQRLSSDSNTSHDAQQSPRHNASVSLQQNSTVSLATLEEVSK